MYWLSYFVGLYSLNDGSKPMKLKLKVIKPRFQYSQANVNNNNVLKILSHENAFETSNLNFSVVLCKRSVYSPLTTVCYQQGGNSALIRSLETFRNKNVQVIYWHWRHWVLAFNRSAQGRQGNGLTIGFVIFASSLSWV